MECQFCLDPIVVAGVNVATCVNCKKKYCKECIES